MSDEDVLFGDIDLFARSGDPATSHEAMAAYDQARLKSAMACVIALHEAHGPLADYELRALFERHFTAPHCAHLYQQARSTARDKGRIRNTGQTKVNPTSGRRQVLWEACQIEEPVLSRCPTCGKLRRGDEAEF